MTLAAAQRDILICLALTGWTVNENLKIPHAKKDDVTLWFKPQSIYFSVNGDFNSARSLHIDTAFIKAMAVISRAYPTKVETYILTNVNALK